MTERLNPYDTNLLSKIEAKIQAKRKNEEFENELKMVFKSGFNPFDLNHVAIFNRIRIKHFDLQSSQNKKS